MGYDFSINYKKEKENKVVDTLSRRKEELEESTIFHFPPIVD